MTEQEKLIITKYDLMFESRLSRCESANDYLIKQDDRLHTDIKELKSDLRWFMSILIAINGALLGVMAKGFHWI